MHVFRNGKRLIALALSLVTVLALCAPAMAASYSGVGLVSGSTAIYQSANTGSAAIASVSAGSRVAISGKSGSFYQVVLNPNAAVATYGWVPMSAIQSVTAPTSKNTASSVTVSTTIPTTTTTTTTTTTGTAGYITNCNSYVNFRATASSSGTKLGTLSKNTALTILGTEGSFYRVQANGQTGYVSKQYVAQGSPSGSSSSSSTSTSGTAGYITNCNSYVNFRATASSSGKKLGTLKKNEQITILSGPTGGFYQVRNASGTTGYVSADYVAVSGGSTSSTPTKAPSTSSGSGVAYGDMRLQGDPEYSKLSSSVKSKLNSAQKSYSDAVGYIYSPGGLISNPIRYDRNLKLLESSYNYVSSFYNTMTRNIIVTAHNNRKSSSNPMFHYLHHYQEKALGQTKCASSTCGKSLSSVKDLNTSSNRTWEIPIFGFSKWELWAMYETQESEPSSTINYNIQHLSNATSSQIQTWINYQLSRANATGSQGKVFSTNVKTNDVFLTLYTCGNEYDSATAQSRLYMFFKAVA